MAHIFDVGTRAWQPDAAEGWIASEVEQKQVNGDKARLLFRLENGEVCRHLDMGKFPYPMKSIMLTIHNARPKLLRPRSPPFKTAMTPISLLS